MLNHLKWYGCCYLKWQSVRVKKKWSISLLMWHSNKTEQAQQAGQLVADGDSVQLFIIQEP